VKQAIDAHNWKIDIESVEGEGSAFYYQYSFLKTSFMKSKIILVEDEIDLGNVVKQYLEISDFEVDWVQNAKWPSSNEDTSPEIPDCHH